MPDLAAPAPPPHFLTEVESKELLGAAGIPVIPARLARTATEASSIATELGFPVVLKVVARDITHKSDVGGVELGLADVASVLAAYDRIMANAATAAPGTDITGVSVQPMAHPGIEVIIGMTTDPQFGPVIMFGLGGIMVEVLRDVAFRLIPLDPRDAHEIVREIKAFQVLEGVRGRAPADIAALEQLVLDVSAFADAHPEVAEIDLNPVFAYEDGAVAVDARVMLADRPR